MSKEHPEQFNEAGFGDADLKEFAANKRFLAAAHAYSLDLLSLGHAKFLVEKDSRDLRIQKDFSPVAYSGLFHEMAKRLRDGRMLVPPELERIFPEVYGAQATDELPLVLTYGIESQKFSDIERLARGENPFRIWRPTFNEEDIQELIKDRRFLACMDAWGKGGLNWGTVRNRMLGPDAKHGPRELTLQALLRLASEIVKRIRSGAITVPPDLQREFPFAYESEAPNNEVV